jgi:hypothetical protein
MKLKVICQKCGKTGEADLNKAPIEDEGWTFEKVSDLINSVEKTPDWDVWFCGDCWRDIEELRETKSRDDFCAFFEDLFQVTAEDLEAS